MKILRRIVYVLTSLIAILAIIALFLPSRVAVERSISIEARPVMIFALVNDFRNFNKWSPWAERGKGVTEYVFTGPDRGVGATMSWTSESPEVGTGRQEIVASTPYERVAVVLAFEGQGNAEAAYDLVPVGEATKVTWSFATEFGYDLFGRYLGLLFDDWIGADYEAGLANLKNLAEELPSTDFSNLEPEIVRIEARPIASIVTHSGTSASAVSKSLADAFFRIIQFMEMNSMEAAGPPLAIQRGFDGRLTLEAAIPIDRLDASGDNADGGAPSGDGTRKRVVSVSLTEAGRALRVGHMGAYRKLSETHAKIQAYIAALGYVRAGDAWEEYVSDPGRVAEKDLQTDVYYPIK